MGRFSTRTGIMAKGPLTTSATRGAALLRPPAKHGFIFYEISPWGGPGPEP